MFKDPGKKLVEAANMGSIETMKRALEAGADVNYRGGFALRRCIAHRNTAAVDLLLDRGATVDANTMEAATNEDVPDIIERLLAKNPILVERQWRALLFRAAGAGTPIVIRMLVQAWLKDGVVDAPSQIGNIIVGVPTGAGKVEAIHELVKLGGDIRMSGPSTLERIGSKGFDHLLQPLLEYGVDLRAGDSVCFRAALSSGSTSVAIRLGEMGFIGEREAKYLKGFLATCTKSPPHPKKAVEAALSVVERGFVNAKSVLDHVAKFNGRGDLTEIIARLEVLALPEIKGCHHASRPTHI